MSPHPNARPSPTPKNFDPYLHELAQRRRAYYASRGGYNMGEENGFEKECWAKPGWGDGFGAPRDEQSEWNGDGLKERLILAFGVVVRIPFIPNFVSRIYSKFARFFWLACSQLSLSV
jgi:hypothetical protein